MKREDLFPAVSRACQEVYGARLVALAVFGSYGRGAAREDSDLDLLIVLRDKPRGRFACWSTFAPVETALAQQGIAVDLSPVFRSPEELQRGFPLMLDMTQDAVILYDPHRVLAHALDRLRQRLTELGARRVPYKGSWYWDLHPEAAPGEVVDL